MDAGLFRGREKSHFAVTGENGKFRLPDLPPGNYTITAWHESMGTLRQEIKISPGETKAINFAFPGKFTFVLKCLAVGLPGYRWPLGQWGPHFTPHYR